MVATTKVMAVTTKAMAVTTKVTVVTTKEVVTTKVMVTIKAIMVTIKAEVIIKELEIIITTVNRVEDMAVKEGMVVNKVDKVGLNHNAVRIQGKVHSVGDLLTTVVRFTTLNENDDKLQFLNL